MFYTVLEKPQGKKDPIFDSTSLAISALNLVTPIKELKNFEKRIIVTKSIPAELMEDRVRYTDNTHVFWETRFSVFHAHKPDWYLLNKLYIMDATGDYHKGKDKSFEINQKVRIEFQKQQALMKTLRDSMIAIEGFYSAGVPQFFNVKECLNIARRKYKFKGWIHEDKVFLELRDVHLGDNSSGIMIYNRIIIVLKDWKIDGYLLRFNNFDYSSYWNMEAIVHPRLLAPYCYMDFGMTIASKQSNMDAFLETLKTSITEYIPTRSLKSLPEITNDFMRYRSLWATHRFLTNDRTELSKEIFGKKIKKDLDK